MKKISLFLTALLCGCLLISACSSSNSERSGAPAGKSKGGVSRIVRVSGYIARADSTTGTYAASGELVARNEVILKTETSGRLVKLYVSDGAKVSKGAPIAKIDDSELRANLKSACATLDLQKKKEARAKALYEKDGATKEELESAENAVQLAEAEKELLEAQLSKTEVRAPFAGTLGIVGVSEGAWMTAGAEIATLVDAGNLRVEFELPQRYSNSVKVGDKVSLYDTERKASATGTVRFMDASISKTSRTRKVRAELGKNDGKFLAGTFVRVDLRFANGTETGMPIPSEALTLDATGAYVFLAKGGSAKKVYVETGLRTPITVNVVRGISPGDTVIVSGLMSMRDGTGVEVKEINNNMSYEARE